MNNKIEDILRQAVQTFQSGNYSSAERMLKLILQAQPKNLPALQIMGLVCAVQHNHLDASKYFKKGVQIDSKDGSLQYNFAKSLVALNKHTEAHSHFCIATRLSPNNYAVWFDSASNLMFLGKKLEALENFEKVLSLNPDHLDAWVNRGILLADLERLTEALESYDNALSLKPDYAEIWSNRGLVLAGLFLYDEAMKSYDNAISIKPDIGIFHFNAALLLAAEKKYSMATKAFEMAKRLMPENADIRFNLGVLRLANFDFSEGWIDYEWRFGSRYFDSLKLDTSKPLWDGSHHPGRLFIWSEQGIGDQILYGSILSDLENLPQKIIVSLDKKLISIFQRSFPKITFVDYLQPIPESSYDSHIPIASLGKFFRNNVSDFDPERNRFLKADRDICTDMPFQKDGGIICGLSWASLNRVYGNAKSAHLSEFAPIFAIKNFSFLSLQYGNNDAEISSAAEDFGVNIQTIKDINIFENIDALASLIEKCDIVVTTSNSTAHVSGALGKETLLLVPYSLGKFWYWHDREGISLWYPSVRVFKQSVQGDWSKPMQEIKTYLENRFET